MANKESPKRNNHSASETTTERSRMSGFSDKIFGMIKFIFGLCLLPLVYAVSVSFLEEFNLLEKALQGYFWAGVISFLIIYLFIYAPARIYRQGYRFIEIIFSFFAPLVKVAPFVLPIYALLVFGGYCLLCLFYKSPDLVNYFLFLFAFTITFHLVFSAQATRAGQEDFLKANYLFGFSLIYIINIILLALCLNFVFKEFSFINFFNHSFQIAQDIFGVVFKQLFLP